MARKRSYQGIERRDLIRMALNDAIRDRDAMIDAYSHMPESTPPDTRQHAAAFREMLLAEYGTGTSDDQLRESFGGRVPIQVVLAGDPRKFRASS